MRNIATIYRFNTPFLNIEDEKIGLSLLWEKIKENLNFEWISFKENSEIIWFFNKKSLIFDWKLWKIDFYYISKFKNDYYLPIFKCDIFLNNSFLENNDKKIKTVWFLTNLFECFDWLNEKEFLLDLDQNIYYTKLFFNKYYPTYDFNNLDNIQSEFESKNWWKMLEDFIESFKSNNFILTKENSNEYHKIHSVVLYYIYLVYIMYVNIIKSKENLEYLDKVNIDKDFEQQKILAEKRLSYVTDLSINNFKEYYNKLEIFFSLFKNP